MKVQRFRLQARRQRGPLTRLRPTVEAEMEITGVPGNSAYSPRPSVEGRSNCDGPPRRGHGRGLRRYGGKGRLMNMKTRARSFFEPTVLTDVTTDMVITREETFGPIAPLYRFKTEDEAVKMANDAPTLTL